VSVKLPSRLSYSSLSSYAECGERWRLERLHHVTSSTWWATIAGSAVHTITEAFDLGKPLPDFELTLAANEAEAKGRGQEIKASGKVLKNHGTEGGPNKKDRDWWLIRGPEMVQAYIDWRALTKWEIPTMPDGAPAIEVRVPAQFAGRDQLGFIDRVFILPDGRVLIVDLKTGNLPSTRLQLGTYAVALRKLWGIDADVGTFWLGKTGDIVTPLTDLTQYSEEFVDHQFEMAWRGIEAGVFLPSPSSMCRGCSVHEFCRAMGGRKGVTIPIEDVLTRPQAADVEAREAAAGAVAA